MNCALWLNRRKIRRASEIPENLDIASLASLRGYFLAGSLSEWLLENGGERYAKRLKRLSPDDPDLNEKLAAVFGGKADFGKALSPAPREGVQAQTPSPAPSSFTGSFPSSFTPRNSFRFTEFGSGSFSYEMLTSFGYGGGFWEFLRKFGLFGSFSLTSWSFGSLGKFHEWEWEWLFELYKRWQGGSFMFTTWTFGSFQKWEWEWLLRLYGGGSFVSTSFSSFTAGFGSFDVFGILGKNLGSFELRKFLENLNLDEYDRIMFETLMMCPLDRFGYGIHNI